MTTVRRVISLYGPAGAGKSQLAKAVAARLSPEHGARIPMDYFLDSVDERMVDAATPLTYDWDRLGRLLTLPDGTESSTPDYDFTLLRRRADDGGRPVTLRPIMLTDGFAPAPQSTIRILLDAPALVRQTRVSARDQAWGTQVLARWARLEATWAHVLAQGVVPDLVLDGTAPIAVNSARVARWLDDRR